MLTRDHALRRQPLQGAGGDQAFQHRVLAIQLFEADELVGLVALIHEAGGCRHTCLA